MTLVAIRGPPPATRHPPVPPSGLLPLMLAPEARSLIVPP